MASVPAAGAVTVTQLGKCTAPAPPYPNLENLAVPGTVKVGSDGRPTGASVGVSIRNYTETYNGSSVDLFVGIFDAFSGRQVGYLETISAGCQRYLWSLRDATSPGLTTGPVTLKRNTLYQVRASGGFTDFPGNDVTGGLLGLFKNPTAYFLTY